MFVSCHVTNSVVQVICTIDSPQSSTCLTYSVFWGPRAMWSIPVSFLNTSRLNDRANIIFWMFPVYVYRIEWLYWFTKEGPRAWTHLHFWVEHNLGTFLNSSWIISQMRVAARPGTLHSWDAKCCIIVSLCMYLCINTGLLDFPDLCPCRKDCICNTVGNWGWHVVWDPKWFHLNKQRIITMHLNARVGINQKNVPIIHVYKAC